jgi:hypothetical protein
MKMSRVRLLIALVAIAAVIIISVQSTNAELVTFKFEGIVDVVDDIGGRLLGGNVQVGDTFSGRYTFESTQPNVGDPDNPDFAQYQYDNVPGQFEMDVSIGTLSWITAELDPYNFSSGFYVQDNECGDRDAYYVGTREAIGPGFVPGGQFDNILIELITFENLNVFSTVDLPLTPPNIALFESTNWLTIAAQVDYPDLDYFIRGHLTSLTVDEGFDADSDGIADSVDTNPNEYSNDFADAAATSGKITNRGEQILIVTDEPDPLGVRIKADPAGGILPATISVCGDTANFSLNAGEQIVINCGSVEIKVINGTVEITFIAADGTPATTSLDAGQNIKFEPETFTITYAETYSEDIVVVVEGEEISLAPGESVLIGYDTGNDDNCNGVDENRNGIADDNYLTTSTSCGVGACGSTGQLICSGGRLVDTCKRGTPAPNDATCNGIDEDCNGTADEDYASTPTSCGQGVCTSTGQLTCVSGQTHDTCLPGNPTGNDDNCNGVDDNCNGIADDNYLPTSTSCGVGACGSTGHLICSKGTEVNTCAPGSPQPEVCDGVDNDCDGNIDEGDVCPVTYTFYGFFSPVDNPPTVNIAKTGQSIPVKWQITDANGTPIADPASFKSLSSYGISCNDLSGDPASTVDEYAAGSSGLQYMGDGNWQFNWKTPKTYAGQCRTMVLTLDDGSIHNATFKFK